MSGISADQKRKRKRKTRAERNKMSRHHMLEEKQKKHTCKTSKDTEPSQNISYTLRSGKGAGLTSFVPKDYKKTTAGSITEDRLTRLPPMTMFSNVKSSGWIKRGPIPETEAVKKKVENDLKHILNLPERRTEDSGGGQRKTADADKSSSGKNSSSDNEPDVMEVDPPLPSSPATLKDSKSPTQRKQTAGDKAAPKPPAAPTPAVVTSCKSGHSITSNSASSVNLDETLDPNPPVQEIADTIMKELKTKFDKMFPNRDIEREICCDLQKLFKQSTHQTEAPVCESAPMSTVEDQGDVCQLSTPLIGISTPSRSTLSACRPPRLAETGTSSPQLNHLDGISTFFQWGVPGSEEMVAGPKVKMSFTTAFLVSDPSQNSEPVFSLGLNDDDEEDDSEDDDDDDDRDILSRACCNAFMASARELEAEKQRLHQMNRYSSYDRMSSSCMNPCNQQKDCSHLWQQSCGPVEVSSGNFQPLHWSGVRSARMLDFSEPRVMTPSSCPPHCLAENLFKDHSHHQHHNHNGLNHHYPPTSCCWRRSPPLFPHGLSTDRETFNNGRDPWRYSRSSQPFFIGATKQSQESDGRSRVDDSLARSRHNFQTALSSACKISDRKHAETENSSKTRSMPFESMDWGGCDDIIHGSHSSGVSDNHHLNTFSSKLVMAQPLSELQTHQADLQRQARHFLNDLDHNGIKSKPDVGCCHILTQPRHLFRVSSPDSNGSPVYMASPLLKGMGLKPGSFV